jgi:hypothetical protein
MEKVTGQVVVRYSRLMVELYDESVARPLSPRRETHGRYAHSSLFPLARALHCPTWLRTMHLKDEEAAFPASGHAERFQRIYYPKAV